MMVGMDSPRKFTFWCCLACGAAHKVPRGICECGNDLAGPTREDWRYMRSAELEAMRYAGRMAGNPSPWDVQLTPSATTKESP